jgi:hypothetical protein
VTLQSCERIIKAGQQTFVEVGTALMQIRDGRLYRAEFRTFEDYCQKRWGWSQNYGKRLVDASAVVGNLKSLPIGRLPTTESQTRPLTVLPPEQQREAWQKATTRAAANNKPVTARDVTSAVQSIRDAGSVPAPPVRESHPDDNDTPTLHLLKYYWRRASKNEKRLFHEWANPKETK